jgi:hypothetical protein
VPVWCTPGVIDDAPRHFKQQGILMKKMQLLALTAALSMSAVALAAPHPNNLKPDTPRAGVAASAVLNNGTVTLGVNDYGNLITPGQVGLVFNPTNGEVLSPGCDCEGWGAKDGVTNVWGGADAARGGPQGTITLVSFSNTATTATSVTRIGTTMEVTHDFKPASGSSNLFQVDVTIRNISAANITALYRRVMDWDVPPTTFDELVTIQRGTSSRITFTSDDGFATSEPASGTPSILFTGNATRSGPEDHGALFDFNFGTVAPGGSVSFTIFYGAAANRAAALGALAAVNAEAYSFGEPSNTPDGTPNTFIFAFAGVGGTPIASLLNPSIPTVGTAGLVGLAVLLAGFAATRVRRRAG